MSYEPKVVFWSTWKDLKGTVEGILKLKKITRKNWQASIEDICSLYVDFYPELFEETKKVVEEHVKSLLACLQSSSEDKVLAEYSILWLEFSQGIEDLNTLYL
jgi:hypothetical protein